MTKRYSQLTYAQIRQTLEDIFEAAYYNPKLQWSRQELADQAGLHVSTIYALEVNKWRVPSYGTILKLASAVRMDSQYIGVPVQKVKKVRRRNLKVVG